MQQRSEETKSNIIASAIKLFSTHGYNTASVDDICKDAGVSKGAFYHHFKSKQALFLALLDGWLLAIDGAIETSKDKPVPETFMQITEAF
ncbi:MAG: TetR/AcrR family transcriptional regulator, partial [Anaerolineales bacterium]|nr:TetR/AcrR family transcriptional regulator [Anaerolineales bacterium]